MILASVSVALGNRLLADNTLVTLVGSTSGVPNIYVGQAPKIAGVAGNSLVYNFFGVGTNDTNDKNIDEINIHFTITTLRDGVANAAFSILDRIDGDAVVQPDQVPTYGLRRHVLDLAGVPLLTHRMTKLWRLSYGPIDSDEPETFIAYEAVYTARIQTAN